MIKPLALIILDGWGIAPEGPGNAITQANLPNFDHYWAAYPHTQLTASGEAVGLPRGEDGNSETGHLNLGAGRIVFQELPRINMSVADESFFQIPAFKAAAEHARANASKLHLMGLIGAGGVHSSIEHLFALMHFAKSQNIGKVYLHLFLDGRDSPPASALTYTDEIESVIKKIGVGKIASLCGRYYAMDRDHHWERTKIAYEMMVSGKGVVAPTARKGILQAYQAKQTDEFVTPIIIDKTAQIENNDAVIFFNFRIDRPRQLTEAFVLPNFEKMTLKKTSFDPYAERYGLRQYQAPEAKTFTREKIIKNLFFVTMTEYEAGLPVQVAFIPEVINYPFSRFISERGYRQYHIAETEKERHVTYYFNGRHEGPFPAEDWKEIPSPRVPSYDQQPEMSAAEVAETLIKQIKLGIYNFLLVNFANPDMVGHTGVLEAGIKACEVTDSCIGKVIGVILNMGGTALITADHGNVEEMIDPQTGEVDTKHSTFPVPLIAVGEQFKNRPLNLSRGILADVAPTLLGLMGLKKPETMTGRDLFS